MSIRYRRGHPFTRQQVMMAETVGAIIALALENAQVSEDMRMRLKESKSQHQITLALLHKLDLDEVIEIICKERFWTASPADKRDGHMGQVLVIGYGNPLRSDDGLGHRAAEMLQNGQCEVIAVHQLTPELVEEIAQAERVAFIDASFVTNGKEAGKVSRRVLKGEAFAPPGLSHHVSPQSLLALAVRLYGRSRRAFCSQWKRWVSTWEKG